MFLKITNSFLSGPVRQYSYAHPEGDRVHREVRPLCRPEMQNRTGVRLKVTVRSGFLKKKLTLNSFWASICAQILHYHSSTLSRYLFLTSLKKYLMQI